MKILHVAPLYHPYDGGAERHVQTVSEELVARGHSVSVLTTNVENDRDLYFGVAGSLPESETLNGVHIHRLPGLPGLLARAVDLTTALPGGYRIASRLVTAQALELFSRFPRNLRFVRAILGSDADVVGTWNWHWPLAWHGYLARRMKPYRLVGIPLFHTAEAWSRRDVYRRMIASCSGVIVNTPHEGEFVRSRTTDPPPVLVGGVGVEPSAFEKADGAAFRRSHRQGQAPLVGFVGRMIPRKGADTVVAAMSRVWQWRPDVQLILAGQQSNPFPNLDRLLASLDAKQRANVLMLPNFPESEKADVLDALDVLVVPSTEESFGIAYLEAWMREKPVIGSRIGPTACVIEDGRDGLLADPRHPSEVGEKIVELLSNPDRSRELGRRGRAKTLRFHTWEKVVGRVERFYTGLSTNSTSD